MSTFDYNLTAMTVLSVGRIYFFPDGNVYCGLTVSSSKEAKVLVVPAALGNGLDTYELKRKALTTPTLLQCLWRYSGPCGEPLVG